MASFEPQRAAFTTKEAVFRVFIQEKMTEIWEVDIRHVQGQDSPTYTVLHYSVSVSLSRTILMSLSGTRTQYTWDSVCDSSSGTIRSHSYATRTQPETCQVVCAAICWRSRMYQYHLSLRLTIMCDSFATCGTAQISTQSQIGLL